MTIRQHWGPRYPIDVGVAAGQVIGGSVTLCGGGTTSCFGLDATLNVWVEFPPMDVARNYAASVMTAAGWWVTGEFILVLLTTINEILNHSHFLGVIL